MSMKKRDVIERVLSVLFRTEISEERIQAFREAAALYREWEKAGVDELKE